MPTVAATVAGTVIAGGVSKALNKPDKSAQKGQIAANERAQDFIEEQAGIAQESSQALFGGAQESLQAGSQAALDIFGQVAPQQIGAFQQGNVAAQQQLIAGLPQQQAALMGLPVDYSAFQPSQIAVDTGYTQSQLPQFTPIEQSLAGIPSAQSPQVSPRLQELMNQEQARQASQPVTARDELFSRLGIRS